MTDGLITYTLSSGVTITANRELINQLRQERADYARELAAKASSKNQRGS